MWLSLTPLEVQVRHKENLLWLFLELTRFYLCQVSRYEQIQDASVSSLMMFLTYCEVLYYFVEMNIANLLYCIDLLSLDSFPNIMSLFGTIDNHFWIYSRVFL